MNNNLPAFCLLVVSKKCNFRCKMCEMWKSNDEINAISTDEWKRFIDSLEELGDNNIRLHFAGWESLAKRIVSSGLDVISISLDSIDEATHDFLRGTKGAYQQAIQAIDYLSKHGANLHNLIYLADWVNRNESLSSVYFQAISQSLAMPKDRQWYEKTERSYLWPQDKMQLDSVID